MCGIAGYVTTAPGSQPVSVLERMTAAMRHRGPDDSGCYTSAHAALGHRRLSIIDLAAAISRWPTRTAPLWIVFNGEIFNHADLRPALERAGHRYETRCDTETILHAYEQYGSDCVLGSAACSPSHFGTRLAATLFCARDRLGIKPLYYYWDGRLFAFASEIKALLEHPADLRVL